MADTPCECLACQLHRVIVARLTPDGGLRPGDFRAVGFTVGRLLASVAG